MTPENPFSALLFRHYCRAEIDDCRKTTRRLSGNLQRADSASLFM